jgi:DNA-binding MarR family transcriptional regulator
MNSKAVLTALRRITRAIYLHSKRLEKQIGLTVPQILVMQTIDESNTLPVSEIARRVSLSQATVSSVIDRLVKKDLAFRERNAEDRRQVTVNLTETGSKKLLQVPELLQEEFIRRFEMLADWEQKMLIASVERIASLMDAQDVDASPILQTGDMLTERSEAHQKP